MEGAASPGYAPGPSGSKPGMLLLHHEALKWWPARVTRPVPRIKSPLHHFNACRPNGCSRQDSHLHWQRSQRRVSSFGLREQTGVPCGSRTRLRGFADRGLGCSANGTALRIQSRGRKESPPPTVSGLSRGRGSTCLRRRRRSRRQRDEASRHAHHHGAARSLRGGKGLHETDWSGSRDSHPDRQERSCVAFRAA